MPVCVCAYVVYMRTRGMGDMLINGMCGTCMYGMGIQFCGIYICMCGLRAVRLLICMYMRHGHMCGYARTQVYVCEACTCVRTYM